MVHNTQNYWGSGLCPSSRILKTRKQCFGNWISGLLAGDEHCSCQILFSVQKTSEVCCNVVFGGNNKNCFCGSVVRKNSELFDDGMSAGVFSATPVLFNGFSCLQVSHAESNATECHSCFALY
jgi:hypothetical protein